MLAHYGALDVFPIGQVQRGRRRWRVFSETEESARTFTTTLLPHMRLRLSAPHAASVKADVAASLSLSCRAAPRGLPDRHDAGGAILGVHYSGRWRFSRSRQVWGVVGRAGTARLGADFPVT